MKKQLKVSGSFKKKENPKWNWAYPLLLASFVYLLVLTVFDLGDNIKTIDTAYNILKIEPIINQLNYTFVDTGEDLQTRKLDVYYISGMNDLRRNILTTIILSMIITYLIMEVYKIKNG